VLTRKILRIFPQHLIGDTEGEYETYFKIYTGTFPALRLLALLLLAGCASLSGAADNGETMQPDETILPTATRAGNKGHTGSRTDKDSISRTNEYPSRNTAPERSIPLSSMSATQFPSILTETEARRRCYYDVEADYNDNITITT
jgi:hypothetical protein